MSCNLQISGKDLNINDFLAKTKMTPYRKVNKGEPLNKLGKRISDSSFAAFAASDSGFDDIKTQIKETIEFLDSNKDNLSHILSTPEVEYAFIDFGVNSMIDDDHLTQGFYFPVELLKLCGELGIGIKLSTYKPDMQLILERRDQEKNKRNLL